MLFDADEFRIIVKKGREYVVHINPKLKARSYAVIDEYVAQLVVERCRQRFEFDSTGKLNTEYAVLQDVKKFVLQGRFLSIV